MFKLRLFVALVIKIRVVNIPVQRIEDDGFKEINQNKPLITDN